MKKRARLKVLEIQVASLQEEVARIQVYAIPELTSPLPPEKAADIIEGLMAEREGVDDRVKELQAHVNYLNSELSDVHVENQMLDDKLDQANLTLVDYKNAKDKAEWAYRKVSNENEELHLRIKTANDINLEMREQVALATAVSHDAHALAATRLVDNVILREYLMDLKARAPGQLGPEIQGVLDETEEL